LEGVTLRCAQTHPAHPVAPPMNQTYKLCMTHESVVTNTTAFEAIPNKFNSSVQNVKLSFEVFFPKLKTLHLLLLVTITASKKKTPTIIIIPTKPVAYLQLHTII
jgi:hypothetical protein